MIDTFKNNATDVCQKVVQKLKMKQNLTESNYVGSSKVDLSITAFKIRYFAALKVLHSKQRQQNEQYYEPYTKLHAKRFSSQNGQYLLTTRQNNFKSFVYLRCLVY